MGERDDRTMDCGHTPEDCDCDPTPEQENRAAREESYWDEPDEADGMIYEEDCCPFCGAKLRSREIFAGCDDSEIYCPDCNYTEGIW